MASSTKLTCMLLLSLLFIQIHARESNFFSKVPNSIDNFDVKETQIPNKPDPLTKKESTPQEQEPNFIPQTQDNGYGLYGHESGQLPPSATKFTDPTTNTAGKPFTSYDSYKSVDVSYKPESEEYYNDDKYNNFQNDKYSNFQNDKYSNFQKDKSKLYAKSFYYNKDLYESRPQRSSFANARLSRDDFSTTPLYSQQNNQQYYYNGGDNVDRHGLSDTRFLENGKYYYDLNSEPHHYRSSSWNNDRGSFGNSYEYGNTMDGFQNDDADFQEEPTEFVP